MVFYIETCWIWFGCEAGMIELEKEVNRLAGQRNLQLSYDLEFLSA